MAGHDDRQWVLVVRAADGARTARAVDAARELAVAGGGAVGDLDERAPHLELERAAERAQLELEATPTTREVLGELHACGGATATLDLQTCAVRSRVGEQAAEPCTQRDVDQCVVVIDREHERHRRMAEPIDAPDLRLSTASHAEDGCTKTRPSPCRCRPGSVGEDVD